MKELSKWELATALLRFLNHVFGKQKLHNYKILYENSWADYLKHGYVGTENYNSSFTILSVQIGSDC